MSGKVAIGRASGWHGCPPHTNFRRREQCKAVGGGRGLMAHRLLQNGTGLDDRAAPDGGSRACGWMQKGPSGRAAAESAFAGHTGRHKQAAATGLLCSAAGRRRRAGGAGPHSLWRSSVASEARPRRAALCWQHGLVAGQRGGQAPQQVGCRQAACRRAEADRRAALTAAAAHLWCWADGSASEALRVAVGTCWPTTGSMIPQRVVRGRRAGRVCPGVACGRDGLWGSPLVLARRCMLVGAARRLRWWRRCARLPRYTTRRRAWGARGGGAGAAMAKGRPPHRVGRVVGAHTPCCPAACLHEVAGGARGGGVGVSLHCVCVSERPSSGGVVVVVLRAR